jgi:hypothetical protein
MERKGFKNTKRSFKMLTKKHPIWLDAAEKISRKVMTDGYGFLITWEEIFKMLDIDTPENVMQKKDFERISLDRMAKTTKLREILLADYNIYLSTERNKGYVVLTPDDQVTIGYDHFYKRVRRGLKMMFRTLTCVNDSELSKKTLEQRDRSLNRTIFIMQAANKRKLPSQKKILGE